MTNRVVACVSSVLLLLGSTAMAQSTEPLPKFEAVDIHPSAPAIRAFAAGPFVHGLRYELKNAAMIDFIRMAYGVDQDKITGGPSWLEFDRYDVVAKAPAGANTESMKLMLQALLADRFGLVFHNESKPFTAYSLTAKAPKLKEADPSADAAPGCSMRSQMSQPPPPPAPGATVGPVMISNNTEMTLTASCHNSTLTNFANSLRGFINITGPGAAPQVIDNTGLTGHYDIDFKFSVSFATGISDVAGGIFEALDKQLGLNLEKAHGSPPRHGGGQAEPQANRQSPGCCQDHSAPADRV